MRRPEEEEMEVSATKQLMYDYMVWDVKVGSNVCTSEDPELQSTGADLEHHDDVGTSGL